MFILLHTAFWFAFTVGLLALGTITSLATLILSKPLKPVLLGFGLAFLISLLIAVAQIIMLRNDVSKFSDYWQNRQAEQGEITYLALGDSAAQGIGASAPQKGHGGLIAERLEAETGKSVRVVNLSVSGARIQDFINDQLPQIEAVEADFVTIEIGANDMGDFEAKKYEQEIRTAFAGLPQHTVVSDMPDFSGGRRNYSTTEANQIIHKVAGEFNLPVAPLNSYLEQRVKPVIGYGADWFHPSDLSYEIWSDAFWVRLQEQIET